MPIRQGEAIWEGNLREGKGIVKLGSSAFEGKYSFGSRFEKDPGTNPEELLGAAHAGCFSMALAAALAKAGFSPQRIWTTAHVRLEKVADSFKITQISLKTEAQVPDIDQATFQQHASAAKSGCPVSQALAATPIELEATLAT